MPAEQKQPATLRELQAVAIALDERDEGGSYRCDRVALFVAAIGVRLGFDVDQLERLIIAGKLHDIGMSTVPDAIVAKQGPLTAEEMEEVRRHPEQGARIVGAAGFEDVALWICHHHERWDGEGYPDGISGPEIPLESRILAIAAALEAMTAERPYRTAMGVEMAAREIAASAGTQFDPGIARIVVDLLQRGALRVSGPEDEVTSTLQGAVGPSLGAAEYARVEAALGCDDETPQVTAAPARHERTPAADPGAPQTPR